MEKFLEIPATASVYLDTYLFYGDHKTCPTFLCYLVPTFQYLVMLFVLKIKITKYQNITYVHNGTTIIVFLL